MSRLDILRKEKKFANSISTLSDVIHNFQCNGVGEELNFSEELDWVYAINDIVELLADELLSCIVKEISDEVKDTSRITENKV